MTSHSRFENLRISDSDDDDVAAIVNNNNNNINNTNTNSSINFISQSITNDKSEVVKNTAADFTSVDVCNDLFSVTNVTQPLPSQSIKVSAPMASTSEHSAASSHNEQFIDNEVNNNIDNELAGNAHRNVVPLVTSEQDDVNIAINPSDTVKIDNTTNVQVASNTNNDNNIVENNQNTKHDNEVRHRHKRVRRPRQLLDHSSKLLTEGVRSKEPLNSTQKSSSTMNEERININPNNNNNTQTITDAQQEQSIKFEEITQSVSQSNSLSTSNKANVCNVTTQNATSTKNNIIQLTTTSLSALPKLSVQSSQSMISPTLPRRDPVIPSPSELDPPIEQSSSFPEEEEEEWEEKLISSHGKTKAKAKTTLHDSSPHGKVVPVVDKEGKQVWMMAVSSHVSKRQTHRTHNAALNDSDSDSKEYSTEEEEKHQEEEEDEEEVVIKPLFAVRPPPRHLSRRAQNIMYAAIQAMESKIRQRHAAAVKKAVQENMATTHQVYNLPNLFIYSVANNASNSTPLAVNYTTNNNNVKYTSSSQELPPPHMRLTRNNASLSPHERE